MHSHEMDKGALFSCTSLHLCLSILRLQSRIQVNYCHKRKLFLWKLLFSTSCTMDKCRWLIWWLVQHCSTLTLFKTGWFLFFSSYMSRPQDFLRVKTSESFTWFISTLKEGSCCPCQFLGCEYSAPSLGHFIVFVGKQPGQFRGLPRVSDNCQRLAEKEKEPSCFSWSWGSYGLGYAQLFLSDLR